MVGAPFIARWGRETAGRQGMILVFGKSGQVARELQKFKHAFLLDRTHADLTKPEVCRSAISYFKPSAVINAAAFTSVDGAEKEAELADLTNGEAPGAMAQACAELQVPMVQISTDYVFDGSGDLPWRTSDQTHPINQYGRSKLKGEIAIRDANCCHAIIRTSWIFSGHGRNFVKTIRRLSESSDTIKVVDDQIGGPTHAKDIAKACIVIAEKLIEEPSKTGTYHLSGQPDVSWYKFAKEILKQTGKDTLVKGIPTSEYKTPAMRPLNSRLDNSLIEKNFGIRRPNWAEPLNVLLKDMDSTDDTP